MNSFKKPKRSTDCSGKSEVFFRKVTIPATFGDELTGTMKPENGAYNNALVFYEASGVSFLYDSDGVYTKIANIEGETAGVISINGKQGVVTITLAELGGLSESQINALIASKGYQTASQIDIKIANAKAQIEREIPTKVSELSNDSGYQNASQVDSKIATAKTQIEAEIPDVIDNVTSTSADDALSAKQGKLLNDRITNLDSRGRYLSTWNATTGEPGTEPEVLPYSYRTGDYFIVATVGATNYRPTGTQYTGTASTVVETDTVSPNDTYLYDGTTWELIHTEIPQIAVDENLSTTSRNPVENRTITGAINDIEEDLDGKQDTLTAGDNITIEDNTISAVIPEKPYVSLERNGEYLYTVTFDTLPEETAPTNTPAGACTAFVRDGKLYRNLDWYYNENVSFRVVTKDFEGMSFASGLTSTALDDEKIAQLPYQIVDGVNRHGIMVSTHVLYNDWGATGTGTIPLTKLPFIVLSQVSSMATLETELGNTLSNMYVPQAMVDAEYLIQVLVTDGTTTYVLRPGSAPDQSYEAVDITNNPKLTNFRWVNQAIVERNGSYMQDRPTGVERWNEIDSATTLEDLRFTLAYESPTRLSEFIGIDDTDKDSTDAELTAIYDLAHAEYLIRQRDGKLWQTMHSAVYGPNGIERLYVQEDWSKDYAYATREYVDEAVEAVEGEIPELLTTTGQSTTAGMTQKAITDALAGAGGELAHKLTTADYNYPANNPTSIALWLLEPGVYWEDTTDSVSTNWGNDAWFEDKKIQHTTYIVGGLYSGNRTIIALSSDGDTTRHAGWIFTVNPTNGNVVDYQKILSRYSIINALTSTDATSVLSARQGKVLKDYIGDLTDLDTTDKTNLVNAINEVAGSAGGGDFKVLTTADYNYPEDNPTKVAMWLLENGIYAGPANGSINVQNTPVASGTLSQNDIYIVGGTYTDSTHYYRTQIHFQKSPSGLKGRAFLFSNYKDGASSFYWDDGLVVKSDIIDSLTSTSTSEPLSAKQGKVLKDLIDSLIIKGSGAPTTATVGTVGKLYEDTTNGDLYQCTAVSGSTYTWEQVGGGGGDPVYSTKNTSNTTYGGAVYIGTKNSNQEIKVDPSAQDSHTNFVSILRKDNAAPTNGSIVILGKTEGVSGGEIAIGQDAKARYSQYGIAIGYSTDSYGGSTVIGNSSASFYGIAISDSGGPAKSYGYGSIAIGDSSNTGTQSAQAQGAISLGAYSNATQQGQFDIGSTNTSYGYNSTNYRLLTGLHDPVSDHDAATRGFVISYAAISGTSAPTTSTVAKYVGQLYYDTTNAKMYYCSAIDTTTPSYTWVELGGGGSGPTVVQTTGTSTTDVMSQKATTDMVFSGNDTKRIQIGGYSQATRSSTTAVGPAARASGLYSIALGGDSNNSWYATASATGSIAIGTIVNATADYSMAIASASATASHQHSIALGSNTATSVQGELNIGNGTSTSLYGGTGYRLLTGVHDGVNAHDAATVNQLNALIDSINSAMNTSIPHIGNS